MTFKEKIDNILKAKQIKLYKLAFDSGLGGTLQKAYESGRDMRALTTNRFIDNYGINREWWNTGKGDIFVEKINKDLPLITQLSNRIKDEENNNRILLKTIEDYGNLVSRLNSEIANLKLTINKYEDRFGIDLS